MAKKRNKKGGIAVYNPTPIERYADELNGIAYRLSRVMMGETYYRENPYNYDFFKLPEKP